MQVIKHPDKKDWQKLLQRPYQDNTAVLHTVQNILEEVRNDGDNAIKRLTKKFDGIELESFEVTQEEIQQAEELLADDLKKAIQQAKKNIETFHKDKNNINRNYRNYARHKMLAQECRY